MLGFECWESLAWAYLGAGREDEAREAILVAKAMVDEHALRFPSVHNGTEMAQWWEGARKKFALEQQEGTSQEIREGKAKVEEADERSGSGSDSGGGSTGASSVAAPPQDAKDDL